MQLLPTEQYKIIDNALSIEEFSIIKNCFLGSDFPWYYQASVAEHGQEDLPEFYFGHTLYNADTRIKSSFFGVCAPIVQLLNVKTLIRTKANLYTNLGYKLENKPHVDFPFEHSGAIFYVNTNDGYTILTDGTKIESKENRLLLFKASESHQSTHCTDQKIRVNINFNYV
jgi:hypothetical protein